MGKRAAGKASAAGSKKAKQDDSWVGRMTKALEYLA